jgi:hypothetical protein
MEIKPAGNVNAFGGSNPVLYGLPAMGYAFLVFEPSQGLSMDTCGSI